MRLKARMVLKHITLIEPLSINRLLQNMQFMGLTKCLQKDQPSKLLGEQSGAFYSAGS